MEVDSTFLARPDSCTHRLFVAVVVETYPPEINGVALTAARLVQSLVDRGHTVQLIRPRQSASDTPRQEAQFTEQLVLGIPIPRYSELRFGRPCKGLLQKRWKARRPDIVHIVTEGPLGWSALNAARQLKIPATSGFHTNFHSYSEHYGIGWLGNIIGSYLRIFHNRSAATMVASADLGRELESAGYQNIRLVGRGVDTSLFDPAKRSNALRQQWGVAADERVALYVGRLAPEKNIDLAIRTFEAMRAVAPMRMVIVGDGPQLASLKKRHPEFVFAGKRLGDDLATHYASADVFLFPSISETFGNVTLEAMASGLPVIAFDYAAAHEHIQHKQNGLVASFANNEQFVGLGQSLAGDRKLIATLGGAARDTAKKISWDAVFNQFEQVILEAARKEKV